MSLIHLRNKGLVYKVDGNYAISHKVFGSWSLSSEVVILSTKHAFDCREVGPNCLYYCIYASQQVSA